MDICQRVYSNKRGQPRVPIVPIYFVIAVELLAIAVRDNVKIKGITQNSVEKR